MELNVALGIFSTFRPYTLEVEEDLYDWALKPLVPIFQSLESNPESNRTFTLHDYFNPVTFTYGLHATSRILVAC